MDFSFTPSVSDFRLKVYTKLKNQPHTVNGTVEGRVSPNRIWVNSNSAKQRIEVGYENCRWEIIDSRVDRDNPSQTYFQDTWNVAVTFTPSQDFGDYWFQYIRGSFTCSSKYIKKSCDVWVDDTSLDCSSGEQILESYPPYDVPLVTFDTWFGKDYYP